MAIRFGTDGWRAVIAEEFTFEAVARLTQALARVWRRRAGRQTPRAAVGYDRRFLSERFARLAAEVLAGNGFRVRLSREPCPTPALCVAARRPGSLGGVMITASHNPPEFNGYKVKLAHGGSADAAFCEAVEAELDAAPPKRLPLPEAAGQRRIVLADLREPHLRAVRRVVDWSALKGARLRVAHDALHGAGAGAFDRLLAETGLRLSSWRQSRDPLFGGVSPEPAPANYAETRVRMRRAPQDLCLVTDGDADRFAALDERGEPVSNQHLICLVLDYLIRHRGARGPVVLAVNTTRMAEKICEEFGLSVHASPVGYKRICKKMLDVDAAFGLEESGSLAWRRHLPDRDGVAAGMWLLERMAVERKPLSAQIAALQARYGPHCYRSVKLRLPRGQQTRIMERLRAAPPDRAAGKPVEQLIAIDGIKLVFRDGSWLMLRPSGTEPLFRVYAEAPSRSALDRLIRAGKRLAQAAR